MKAWREAAIRRVRQNDALTREQKRRRIKHINEVARKKIRRILRAGHKPPKPDTDAGDEGSE